jgi:prepilin-type N-terminal cleavage/methylation domain-containing protein
MKKGFTLAELLGVIAILALITMIAVPSIISLLKNQDSQLKDIETKTIIAAAEKYVQDQPNKYSLDRTNSQPVLQYNILVSDLIKDNYLDEKIVTNSKYYSKYYVIATNGTVTKDITVVVSVVDANRSLSSK